MRISDWSSDVGSSDLWSARWKSPCTATPAPAEWSNRTTRNSRPSATRATSSRCSGFTGWVKCSGGDRAPIGKPRGRGTHGCRRLGWLHQPSVLKELRRGWVDGANPAYGRDACTDARVRSTPAGETIRVPPRIRGRHDPLPAFRPDDRSEEHTSELQSLMRISYAVFCLKKKNET